MNCAAINPIGKPCDEKAEYEIRLDRDNMKIPLCGGHERTFWVSAAKQDWQSSWLPGSESIKAWVAEMTRPKPKK